MFDQKGNRRMPDLCPFPPTDLYWQEKSFWCGAKYAQAPGGEGGRRHRQTAQQETQSSGGEQR